MKIIQVSDLHLVQPGELLFGTDPLLRLERCIEDINRNHADADLVVFSGDLTNDGQSQAYLALANRLAALHPPHRLMMGNHDDRAKFAAAFPEVPVVDGFVQAFVDLPDTRVILLDTLEQGRVEGRLCQKRLDWLDAALENAANAFVFMHHPPLAIGIPSLDDTRLANGTAFRAVLERHGNVRHIFAGHVHRAINGSWAGIPFTTIRSTNHQSALKFRGAYDVSYEEPAFAILLTDMDSVVVHLHEFDHGSKQADFRQHAIHS